jgi:hypothetical protein
MRFGPSRRRNRIAQDQPTEKRIAPPTDLTDDDLEAQFRLVAVGDAPALVPITRRLAVVGAGVLVAVILLAMWWSRGAVAEGTLQVDTETAGALVNVDGVPRGRTPVLLSLPPGAYQVSVTRGTDVARHMVSIAEGERVVLLPKLAPPSAPAPAQAVAVLSIATDGTSGDVTVDGVRRGRTPIQIRNLLPGEHEVVVQSQQRIYRNRVVLEAGKTTSLVVGGGGAPSAAAGWLRVQASTTLDIREKGRLIGRSDADRLMIPAGEHLLEFSNRPGGFQTHQRVRIAAEATSVIRIEVPSVPVNLNAQPWAEVWVDGERIGETPIANHPLVIGSRQIEFRHPTLGVKRVALEVALGRPNRLAVNMSNP